VAAIPPAAPVAAIPPAALAAEIARLAGPDHGELAVAVSGGTDSLALMALAAAACPGRVHVLSVDHGLRAEAAAECAHVARLAAGLGLPHHMLTLGLGPGGNVQARARTARYAAMADWCRANHVPLLLTAHHADDQAETLLMRLARGSGVAGLAGVRASVDLGGVLLLRPLLGWQRASLAAIVRAAGWAPVDDPSNSDPAYDRTRARQLLAATGWLQADRIAAAATHLAEAEAALDWAADLAFSTRTAWQGDVLRVDPQALPAEIRRRLLARALAALGAEPDGPALQRLLVRLASGKGGTLGAAKAAAMADGLWRIGKAPPRKPR